MISFNVPLCVGTEQGYIAQAIGNRKICGDGAFTQSCSMRLEELSASPKVLLTTSGTHALEMATILTGIGEGDEVICPSYTFSSSATAIVIRGGVPVFVDIRPDTMNIDETLIEDAITPRTKALMVVHYAGVSCEMDTIMDIAARHGLRVIEDAAQGVMASYKGRALGSLGDFGCYSFHETKNISCGEGGALLVNDKECIERAEIVREKGTDRSRFYRGQVDKYTWVESGSSYLPSELNAAYLWAQLEQADEITQRRRAIWNHYRDALQVLGRAGILELPVVPEACVHNGHMFWIKAADLVQRATLITFLKKRGIDTVFHYIPLHSSPAGMRFGRFHGEDRYTTRESERLLRLPLHCEMSDDDVDTVVKGIKAFFRL